MGIKDLTGFTKTQIQIIEDYCEKFGGVELGQTDYMAQLYLNKNMITSEGLSYYWMKKFGENFRDFEIGIPYGKRDYGMYITLFKNEKGYRNRKNKHFVLSENEKPFNPYVIPFGLARILRDKGFEGNGVAFYATTYEDGRELTEPKLFYSFDHQETAKINQVIIDTPTPCWTEAFDWLRKVHNIYIYVGIEETQVYDQEKEKWEWFEEETSVVYKIGSDGRSTRSGCTTQQLHELALKEALEMI